MKVTPVTDRLIALTRLHFVNAYLVREDDGFTLVDTTVGGAAGAIIAAAERAGAPIRRIALTHGHGDHAGSLDALAARLPGVEVALGEADARILAGTDPKPGKGSWPKVATAPSLALRGGERIGSLEVVPCPGHSPGHVAFLDTRDRTLIAGDVFTSYGSLAVTTHYRTIFPLAVTGRHRREREDRPVVRGHGE